MRGNVTWSIQAFSAAGIPKLYIGAPTRTTSASSSSLSKGSAIAQASRSAGVRTALG
nr:hypothetical protein [Mumia sp. zg.B53]